MKRKILGSRVVNQRMAVRLGNSVSRRMIQLCLALFVTNLFSTSASAAELSVGDKAPAFELSGSDGKVHRLSDYEGTIVVLAWFPKAFTSG